MGEREQAPFTATVIPQGAAREITVYFLFWNWLAQVSRDLPTSTFNLVRPSHRLFLKCLQNVMARSRQWDRNVKQCVRDRSSSSCHNFIISAVWSWLFFVYRSPRCTALPYCKNEPQLHRNSSLLHFALPFPNRIECTTVGRMTKYHMVLSFEAGLSKTFTSALLGSSGVGTSHAIIITRTGKIRFRIVIMTHVFILCAFSLCTFYRFPTISSKVLKVKAFQVSFDGR